MFGAWVRGLGFEVKVFLWLQRLSRAMSERITRSPPFINHPLRWLSMSTGVEQVLRGAMQMDFRKSWC